MLVAAGAPQAFILLDAVAFALLWFGARVTRRLPAPLEKMLLAV
jgi:hypothetical protein